MRKSSQLGDIQEMANLLEIRKNSHQHTTLLLGARAGQLFRSARFYEELQFFSNRNFHRLSRIKQFKECYAILTSGKFCETDLNGFLLIALRDIDVTSADISLASLIRNQYFDEIISTNIDDVLEDALLRVEMKEGRDYEVMRIGRNPLRYEKSGFCRITKVFGDFESRDYTVRGRASYIDHPETRSSVQSLLKKDLLIVGIDPDWDKDILRLIPTHTRARIWFVSEDNDIVGKSSFLSDILRARDATYILGPGCSYDFFVRKLHEYLCGNIPPNYSLAHHQTIQHIQQQVSRMVDILEPLTSLMDLLPGIKDQMQSLQKDNRTFFSAIQKIQKKLEEIEKDRDDS